MFDMFKKKNATVFQLDEHKRPLRPAMPGLFEPENADAGQKQLALSWVWQWLALDEQTAATDTLPDLDAALIGELKLRETPDHAALRAAVRAIRSAAAENRANRTVGAFPWRELRLEPQIDCCQKAAEIAGTMLPAKEFPALPLAGCDAAECACWFRQVTKSEHQRRTSGNNP